MRVTFTDDAGHSESLTSEATGAVAARPNRAATGAPSISGTAEVGQTLTADTSGIADADGLANVAYAYQWLRDGTDIDGATGETYELTDADAGKALKVRVTFTDDAGHSETLTSAATGAVAARPNRAATGAPSISGTAEVGQTLTADTSGIADADGLANVAYAFQWLRDDAGYRRRHGRDLRAGGRRRGHDAQGAGDVHGRRRALGDADQCGDGCGRGAAEPGGDGRPEHQWHGKKWDRR